MLNLSDKNILITGGCGFIGSNFIKYISENFEGFLLVNIDKMGLGSRDIDHIHKKSDDYTYIEVNDDIANIESVELNHFKRIRFDYIFHFAAESHVDRSISNPTHFIENNVLGMIKLLEWMRNYQPHSRMINISTDEVFGHLKKDDPPFTEESPFSPRSPYSASKASADLITKSYVETYGLDIVTTHCCNNFGPHQGEEKLIPTIIRKILNGEKVPIYGDGKNIREWIHVDDHNKSLLEIAEIGKLGHSYNVGSGYETTNLQMVVDIAQIIGIKHEIEFVEDRKGHDFRYSIKSLKYERGFDLKKHHTALIETVNSYLPKK